MGNKELILRNYVVFSKFKRFFKAMLTINRSSSIFDFDVLLKSPSWQFSEHVFCFSAAYSALQPFLLSNYLEMY